ncbi:UspA domain protein [Methanosalsum zhilinae DSM 4017]|uniref:UspA domain protein n=1 Tax=Methanosalsum zhilinae (strain DSM 4017 / NBRC 107636 / OCM 62 / WeN5) TaxID=679901 RepID=F7XNR7_METZD|nr:universal stress protein [Methanosalsum zhilinae]AEH61268.1 UspA domain protein [Methanosalsum zhilinae DSM 4017]
MDERLYEKILIATDGSKNVQNAVDLGIEIAKASGAKVYAVMVVPSHSLTSYMKSHMEEWEAPYDTIRQVANKAIEYVMDKAKMEGVEATGVILEGHPPEQITAYAHGNNMDLIVMGTLGRTGIDRFLIGSVSENVIRHSKVKVLVVPSNTGKK